MTDPDLPKPKGLLPFSIEDELDTTLRIELASPTRVVISILSPQGTPLIFMTDDLRKLTEIRNGLTAALRSLYDTGIPNS